METLISRGSFDISGNDNVKVFVDSDDEDGSPMPIERTRSRITVYNKKTGK